MPQLLVPESDILEDPMDLCDEHSSEGEYTPHEPFEPRELQIAGKRPDDSGGIQPLLVDRRRRQDNFSRNGFLDLISKHIIVSSPDEGYFCVLTDDLIQEIFKFVEDDLTFARISQVNHRWYAAAQYAWKNLCDSRGYLRDIEFWLSRGKGWKWMLQCYERSFNPTDEKDSVGNFKDGNWHYYGEWKDNKRHGYGFVVLNDQERTTYRGQWSLDKRDGYGVVFAGDHCLRYEGNWSQDKKNGFGRYVFSNGDTYEGYWKDNKKHGYGVYVFGVGEWEGDKYAGDWIDDQKSGHGVYTWKDGDVYEGGFENDNFNGFGKYYYSCGDIYEGGWKDDIKKGYGEYFYSHGGIYKGNFKAGCRHGPGQFIWKDGDRFVGEWHKGSRIGLGTLFTTDGQVIRQTWNEPPKANYSKNIPSKYS